MENNTNKTIWIFFLFSFLCLDTQQLFAQRQVVAYFSDWGPLSKIPYKNITCLNYAFVRLKGDGTLEIEKNREKLSSIVATGHQNKVNVVVALADTNGEFNSVTKDPVKQKVLIRSIMDMVKEFNLDGIDIDWEYPASGDGGKIRYLALIKTLSQQLVKQGKILCIVVPGVISMGEGIPDEAFSFVTYVGIMAYDDPQMLDGSHSSYKFALNSLNYWMNIRGVPKKKALLGVPTYARNNEGKATYYKDLLSQGASANENSFNGVNYNGKSIMLKKINLAKNRCNGVTIWEVNGDRDDKTSMIKFISDQMRNKK